MTAPTPDPADRITKEILRLAADVDLDRPIDQVIRRIELPDGPEWFLAFLGREPMQDFVDPVAALIEGRAELQSLREAKRRAKALLRAEAGSPPWLDGILAYFLLTGAALLHHGRLIGSAERAELDPMLLDLAGVLPEEWSRMLARATFVSPT